MARWFRGELREFVETVMRESELVKVGIFDGAVLRQMFGEHLSGSVDHNFRIWMVLNIEVWFRMFILGHQKESVRDWISLSLEPR